MHPNLDLHDMPSLVEVFEACNRLPVPARHPYAGELVFTAFSGSHQDAIRKGLAERVGQEDGVWEVPYLPVDPADIGRAYEPVIRINSQSGKSGMSYVLERDHGYRLPKALAIEFSHGVQVIADATGKELASSELLDLFEREYLTLDGPFVLEAFTVDRSARGAAAVRATVRSGEKTVEVGGHGTGPIDAFVHAVNERLGANVEIVDYAEHALGEGAAADAVAYVELRAGKAGSYLGVGRGNDIVGASLAAVVRALNRAQAPEISL